MKTAKRRVLSFLMALFVMVTTVCGHVDYTVAAEETTTYAKVTSAEEFTTGSYVMVLNTGYAPTQYDASGWILVDQPTINEGIVTDTKGAIWTLTVNANEVQLKDSNGVIVAPKGGNSNGIKEGEYNWTWSFSDGKFVFKGQGDDTVTLASNASVDYANKLRGYKNGTVTGNPTGYPSEFTLYKASGESVNPGEPSTGTPGSSDTTVPSESTTETPVAPVVATIAEAVAGTQGTSYQVKGVVTFVDGKNIYIQDETGGICLYLKEDPNGAISLGDTIVGTGNQKMYSGLPELEKATYEKSEGMTLNAKTTTIAALATADICTYVKIANATVTDISTDSKGNKTITVNDGTATLPIYKAVCENVNVGDVIEFNGAVGIFNTLQLRNTLSSEIIVTKKAPTYNTIAEALAGEKGTEFTVKGVVTLVDGKNIYVQDATGGIDLYFASAPADIALGDTVIGTGSKDEYNGLPELVSATYEKSEGLTLTAKKTTIPEITIDDVCEYVELKGVTVKEVYDDNGKYSNPNITVTDGTNDIQIYKAVVGKTDNVWNIAVGDVLDIKAAVGINKGKVQLRTSVEAEITAHVESNGLGKVTSAEEFTTGTYVIVCPDGYAPTKLNGNWVEVAKPTIENGVVTDSNGTVWTLTVEGNEVVFTDSFGQTIKPSGGEKNGITSGSYKWAWKFNEDGTFTFLGQGSDTVTLATNNSEDPNYGGFHKIKAYKNTTAAKDGYCSKFTLYKVEKPEDPGTKEPVEGSKVVIYNVSAKGVLATQDDNVTSPSILNAAAKVENGAVTAENGAVIFEVQKNGEYYRFYNETFGYLASNGTGSNAFYTKEVSEDVDWKLAVLGDGFQMESRTAKYKETYSQYLEYYSDSYKTYSMYNVTDYDIFTFQFYPCSNIELTGGVVNKPATVVEKALDANINIEYTFTFEVSAPFGVKELAVTLNDEAVEYTVEAGIYKVVVPAEKVVGEKLVFAITGKDNKDVAFTGDYEIVVKDEPGITNVNPASNGQTLDEKKPVISADITNAGEEATVVMSVDNEVVESVYADGKVTYTPATNMEDGRHNVTVTVTRKDGKTVTKTWSFTVGKAEFQLYFGQLHSHTTYSDGSGTLDSALDHFANLPDSANVDFVAFTDHSNYFDTKDAVNPEAALYDMSLASASSQELWNSYKNSVAAFNAAHTDKVAIGGFEMTWSGGPGHINTFNTPGIVSRNNATLNNKTNDAGMKEYYALISQAEGIDSLSQFNHPGSTFGTFSDFAYWDAVLDTRIQLVEVGNGEGAIGAGGYFPSYEYYTMALDKGWHLSPTNNQDNHKGKWGNANDARDVVLTDNFTEEGIYQAIRDMRVYATEDKNLEIYYTLNGLQLGSTIEEKPETPLAINVNLYDPDATDSISKVEVIVNSGKTAYTWDDPAVLATGNLTCEVDPVYSYYYIRVTQGDGDLAVTTPVWVGETLKLGISSVECGTSTPVTGEELTITTTLFNSESTAANVKALTYTANGSEVIGTDTTEYSVAASGTKAIDFKFTPEVAKLTKITVTAVVEQKGVEYTFTMDVTLDVQDATKLAYIGIDAAHYNEYVAGNYKDSMGNFGKLAADYSVRTVELKTSEDLIAACSNDKYKALILTAPSRRLAAAQSDPRTYSAEELAAIKAFNENGGTVVIAGWSDNYENYSVIQDNAAIKHMSEAQNDLLVALGSSIRIGDDATYDDERSKVDKVDPWRLYFNTYGENFLTEGVEVDPEHPHDRLYTEVFSHYGGATIYTVDTNGNPTSTLPETVSPVVYAHSTTYSVDVDKDGRGGADIPKYAYATGDDRLMVMALEQLEGKGAIIVSGAAFMSNFEVQATIEDSAQEKNYSNYRICENLVQYINPVTITPIAEVQAQKEVGYKYTIEGIVTTNASGYDKDTAFFDCIYVQDATGGVCCFPVAGNYKIGDKVRVTGTTEFYQGEMELQVSSIEVIGSGTVTSKSVTAAQINDLSVLGQLVTLTGKVVSFEMANGLVQTIMVQDAAGNVARVFIDGYITTGKDVQNLAVGRTITVTGISSFDDTFNAPNGPFPRIRVKDRSDVICTAGSTGGSTGGSSSSGSGSYTPEEETTEAPSTEAPTTKPGTTTQKPSTEENTTTTPSTEPVEVIIPVNGSVAEQTEAIVEAIKEVKAGNDVVIKVEDTESGEVAVSVEVFKTLEENKKVDLVVELANGFTWTIDASTVDTSKVEAGLEAINLFVEIVEEVIPAEIVKETAGENKDVREISLKHNGEFGFTAALDVPLGKEFAGRNATLYYFNPEAKALEAQELVTIDEFGKARFTFTHASDYVVVIEEAAVEAPIDTEVNTEAPVDTEGQAEGNATPEEKGGSPVIVIILVLLAVAAGCFAFAYSKKKK